MKKRILSIVLCLCMMLGLLPTMALAAAPETPTRGTGLDLTDKTADVSSTTEGWSWDYDLDGSTLTLTNAYIKAANSATGDSIALTVPANTTIVLVGDNRLEAGSCASGGTASCHSYGLSAAGSLSISGKGSLTATGNHAGIYVYSASGDAALNANANITTGNVAVTSNSGAASVHVTGGRLYTGLVGAAALTVDAGATVVGYNDGEGVRLSSSGSCVNNGVLFADAVKRGVAGGTETVTPSGSGVTAAWGADVSAASFDLSTPPAVKTGYLAGGGYAVWEPTLAEDGTATGGTLAFNGATINVTDNAENVYSVTAVTLPNLTNGVNVVFKGESSIAANNTTTATAFKCLGSTSFDLMEGSDTTLAAKYGENDTKDAYVINAVEDGAACEIKGTGKLTMNAAATSAYAIIANSHSVKLSGGTLDLTGAVTGDVSVGNITVPSGKTLDLSSASLVTFTDTVVNNGTIVLPSTNADDIPADIKALGLTGTGKVTVNGTDYSNAGGKALGAITIDDTTTDKTVESDGYRYDEASHTLYLDNTAVISALSSGISFDKGTSTMTFAIVLVGQNSVSVSSSNAYKCSGIYSNADLTVSGEGTLDVGALSTKESGDCSGIWTDNNNLTISSDVTASAASVGTVTGSHNYGMNVGGGLTVGESCTVTATAGNADYGSDGISVEGDLSLENGAVVSASSGDVTRGYSNGVYGAAKLTLGEDAKLSATAGNTDNSYCSMGLWLEPGAVSLGKNATLEATGSDANGEGAGSYGLYIGGLTVGEGASVTAKSGSAETTYGISNYGANINVAGGTVKATAGNATGADSYSYGIDVANCNIIVTGAGTVDATGGKAINSSGIELAQGFLYDSSSRKITTYYDNGKLILSGSAKVTAKSGDPAGAYPGSVGLICPGLSLSDSASLDAQGVNYGIRAAGVWSNDEDGEGIQSTSAISVSDSASLSAASKSDALPGFGLHGCAAVDVSGGTAKFAGSTAAVYLYGEDSNVAVASGLTAATTPAGGTLKSASVTAGNTAVTCKSYTAGAALTVNETTGVPTNACTAVTIAKAAPAASSVSGDTTKTTTNPDGSTTTVVTKPDGSTTTTVKQPDGVATVTSADKNGSVTGATVTVPDTVQGDVPVSIPADLGKESGAVSAVVTYPDGTKKTVVGNYSDGKIDLNVGGSATIEILDDFVPLASLPLTDVPSDAYYHDAVIWAAMNGVTDGKTDTTFAPNDTCTRAEAVTFLWRAMGSPAPTGTACPFTDVSADAYYYKAVLWAVEKGVTDGTSAAAFSPNDPCTRAQVVTFQWRAAGSPAAAAANPFTDVGSGLYYTDAVLWAVSEKITEGTTATTFSPAQDCTRAQIVTFLWRQLGK